MDDLEQLLAKADAPAPPVRKGLASAVRQVVSHRRRRRRTIAAGVVLITGGTIALFAVSRLHPPVIPIAQAPFDVAAFHQEIAELDADANLHAQTAAEMEKAVARDKQLRVALATLSRPDALMQLDERRQSAAQLMLAHAKQLELDPKRRNDATASYRALIALFPNTQAGREANQRLNAGV